MKLTHDKIEQSVPLLIVLVILVIAVGGLVEIVPLYFQRDVVTPVKGIKPYEPLRLVGRDIYIREGCYNCHSQMIRPFRAETLRYGHYSVAGEFVYDHPFQWGSKRTAPIWRGSARATRTNGIASTSIIRATSCRSRTCRRTRGSRKPSSTARMSRRG